MRIKQPSAQVRETIIRALDYLRECEPAEDPAEEAADNRDLAVADAWIRGEMRPMFLA